MKQGVSMQYFISRNGNTLYPRDSLLKKYQSIIARVQNLPFLMEFLDADKSRRIEICFFDDRAFNNYHIDGFNKNPSEWAKYDALVKRIPGQKKIYQFILWLQFQIGI